MAAKKSEASAVRSGYKKRSSSGEINKWEKGMEVEGEIAAIRRGQMGFLLDMRLAGGDVQTYGCPTILKNAIEGIPGDVTILIVCTGTKPSRYAREMYLFEVYEKD